MKKLIKILEILELIVKKEFQYKDNSMVCRYGYTQVFWIFKIRWWSSNRFLKDTLKARALIEGAFNKDGISFMQLKNGESGKFKGPDQRWFDIERTSKGLKIEETFSHPPNNSR